MNLVFETDENYENLKKLYLNDALEVIHHQWIDSNSFRTSNRFGQSKEFAFLDKTRSRTFFVNTSWRDARREQGQNLELAMDFGITGSVSINVASRCSTRLGNKKYRQCIY